MVHPFHLFSIEYERGRGKELNGRTGSTKYPEHFGLIRIAFSFGDIWCWRRGSCWLGSFGLRDGVGEPICNFVCSSDAISGGSLERVTVVGDGEPTRSELAACSLLAGSDILLSSVLLAFSGVETGSALLSSRPVFIF